MVLQLYSFRPKAVFFWNDFFNSNSEILLVNYHPNKILNLKSLYSKALFSPILRRRFSKD